MKKVCLSIFGVAGLLLVSLLVISGLTTTQAREGGGEPPLTQQREYYPMIDAERLVEVVVGGRPLDVYHAQGKRYIEALRGQEYDLRIRNPYPVRVAVALAVDGLNTIDARRTTRWEASKWVIEPYQTITISGWQMSSARARRFYFTSERDSYAAKLNRPSDLGVIAAVFFRERGHATTVTRPSPRDLPRTQDNESKKMERNDASTADAQGAGNQPRSRAVSPPSPVDDDYAATGVGRSVRNDVRWTHLDLDPRPAHEVTIRYEYHDALVRLGVLPRPYSRPEPLGRRERARGFEDPRFCPEP